MLRFEDNLWGEDYYYTAATGIARIYLHLFDNPSILEEGKEPDYSKMTAAERKKAKAIARKKRLQAEKKTADKGKSDTADNGEAGKNGKISPVEEDPDGKELLKLNALEEARKYSSILSNHCPKRFGTWRLQYDVAIRRKKWLLALQALYKMRSMDSSNADFFSCLIDFALKSPSMDRLPDPANVVLKEEFPNLLKGASAKDYVSEAAKNIRNDQGAALPYRVAVAEGLVKTGLEPAGSAASIIIEGGLDISGVSVESCTAALESMKALGPETRDLVEKWISMVKIRFPLMKDLKS